MKIDIKKKKEYIECGDLVYSDLVGEYGFVCIIEDRYFL